MAVTDISLLTQSPGPMKVLASSGANYHEGADIICHLTRCLGPAGWSWTTGEHGYDELADQVYVVGTLTVRVTVLDAEGCELVIGTTHTERGWKGVARSRKDGSFVDLGNDYKSADTDALKRAARLVGVGLDAWMKTAPQSESRPAPQPRPAPAPTPLVEDLSPAAREDLATRYVDLLARARALDFRASWAGADHRAWTDAQLGKYAELLQNYVARTSPDAA